MSAKVQKVVLGKLSQLPSVDRMPGGMAKGLIFCDTEGVY